jgi:hypothetical protein
MDEALWPSKTQENKLLKLNILNFVFVSKLFDIKIGENKYLHKTITTRSTTLHNIFKDMQKLARLERSNEVQKIVLHTAPILEIGPLIHKPRSSKKHSIAL